MTPGSLFLIRQAPTLCLASGYSSINFIQMACFLDTRPGGWSEVILSNMALIMRRLSVQSSSPLLFKQSSALSSPSRGLSLAKCQECLSTVTLMRSCIISSPSGLWIQQHQTTRASYGNLSMASSRLPTLDQWFAAYIRLLGCCLNLRHIALC